jgi:hypothetical protein
MRSGKIA